MHEMQPFKYLERDLLTVGFWERLPRVAEVVLKVAESKIFHRKVESVLPLKPSERFDETSCVLRHFSKFF